MHKSTHNHKEKPQTVDIFKPDRYPEHLELLLLSDLFVENETQNTCPLFADLFQFQDPDLYLWYRVDKLILA